jgi:hypothetical protein
MKRPVLARLAVVALCLAVPTHAAAPERPTARDAASTRLARRVSIDIASRSLKDVFAAVKDISLLDLQPLWKSDAHADGLDPAAEISILVQHEPVTRLLERILERADPSGSSTWQLTQSGAVQLGPRSRLNAFKRLHIYNVSDLLRTTPDHRRAPTIDLQQALQKSGTAAPISDREPGSDSLERAPITRERALELAELIRATVETSQWEENGGDGGSVFVYEQNLIVTAPDYIHRGIARPQ